MTVAVASIKLAGRFNVPATSDVAAVMTSAGGFLRQLTVKIKFTRHCLGIVQDRNDRSGKLLLSRTPDGHLMFLTTWHQQNMKLAAELLGRHHTEVNKILWDVSVESSLGNDRWYRRWYSNDAGRERFATHEAVMPGQIVGISCAVPATISDADFVALMNMAGRYRGLSPYKPGEYGHFQVSELVVIGPDKGQHAALETDTAVK